MTASRPQCPTCGTIYAPNATYCPVDGSRLSQPNAPPDDELIGRDIDGRYLVRGRLGAGGMATVYTGVQVTIEREVAIKVIRPEVAGDPAIASRIVEAGRIACQLAGPSVITVFDVGHSNQGLVYLVMELVRGRTLAAELALRPLQARRVVGIAMQICDALAVAHGRGVAHGCLRPSNVMLVDDSVRRDGVKVLDFGMVSPPGDPDAHVHARYLAPELGGGRLSDPRADLYALGCIMYELLTGRPAFADARKHHGEAPKLPPNVPLPLADVIAKLFAKNPNDRPGSAPGVRRLLEPLHVDLPAAATSPPPVSPVPATPAVPAVPVMPPPPTGAPSSEPGMRILRIAVIAVIASGLGLLGYYLAV